jgi:hypothetical protein
MIANDTTATNVKCINIQVVVARLPDQEIWNFGPTNSHKCESVNRTFAINQINCTYELYYAIQLMMTALRCFQPGHLR